MTFKLNLEGLFTPRLLEAFHRAWGPGQAEAERMLRKVLSIFEEHLDETDGTAQARRRAFLGTLAVALVGQEPDFNAWLEAFAVGSFDLPDDLMYARARGKGSPSRFLRRQRERIEGMIDQSASPEEQDLQRRAYMDAIRLILASLVVREAGRGVAAKAAIGTGWPIMIASERLNARNKKLLNHFGKDDEFLSFLAVRVEQALQAWIDEHLGGRPPILGRSKSYEYTLPPGVSVHDALTYLDREDLAIDRYRAALWHELGLEDPPAPVTGACRSSSEAAAVDANELRHVLAGARGWETEGSRLTQGGSKPQHRGWLHFTEAREENNPFDYTPEAVSRLARFLRILREEKPPEELVTYARYRADLRRSLRKDSPGLLMDEAVQHEIERWVDFGNPPPAMLRPEHAGYYEEEVCRRINSIRRDARWRAAGLYPPGSEFADIPF